jgi:tellurite resistance protein TehA-like permease
MNDPWYVILRDLMVILSAASLIVVCVFTALVVWRLYKLAKEVRGQLEPIIGSMGRTADTVKVSGSFMTTRQVPSPMAAVGVAAGTYHLYNMLRMFQRGMASPPAPPATDAEPPAGGDASETGGE